MPVGLVDRDVVVGFGEIQFTEDVGPSDVIGEGSQGWKREAIKNGLDVQQAEIPTRPVFPRGFKLKMQWIAPGSWL